jgi:serine/threonine protein kinase
MSRDFNQLGPKHQISGKSTFRPDVTFAKNGTGVYRCPSAWAGSAFSYEADHWAMGIIMHWCLFDEYPFEVKIKDDSDSVGDAVLRRRYGLEEERDGIDPYTGDLLRRLLDKSPFSRIKSAAMKRHPFFADVDWVGTRRREFHGPFWDFIPDNLRALPEDDEPQVGEEIAEGGLSIEELEDCPKGILSPTMVTVADLSVIVKVTAEMLALPEARPVMVPDTSHTSQISALHLLFLLPLLIPLLIAVSFV